MGSIEAGVAILLLIAFIGGMALGVVAVVAYASRREDRLYSLTGKAPGPASQGVRILTGAGTLGTGFLSAGLRSEYDRDEAAQGQEPWR
jgi:hypothetical protein